MNTKMEDYTYKDGLKILDYVGINSLTRYEKSLIRKKWAFTCKHFNNNAIDTIEILYVGILPLFSHSKNYGEVMEKRSKEFKEKTQKLNKKGLEMILRS